MKTCHNVTFPRLLVKYGTSDMGDSPSSLSLGPVYNVTHLGDNNTWAFSTGDQLAGKTQFYPLRIEKGKLFYISKFYHDLLCNFILFLNF
mgnify:CR=1 FL=1